MRWKVVNPELESSRMVKLSYDLNAVRVIIAREFNVGPEQKMGNVLLESSKVKHESQN
jgi:hypothetical protein